MEHGSSPALSSASPQSLSPHSLTDHQVEELTKVLERPLMGREVLMPLGKYAFVTGRLQPDQQDSEEMLQVPSASGDVHQTVSRAKALEWLRPSIAASSDSSSLTKEKEPTRAKKNPGSSHSSTSTSTSTSKPAPVSSGTVVPTFVEIHEEYDAQGQPIRSDVVDMNQQLETLWNLTREDASEFKMDDMDRNWMNALLQPGSRSDGNEEVEETVVEEKDPDPKALSDSDYDQLSKRLEELARLEEEEARTGSLPSRTNGGKKPKTPQTVSKGGWNKGFLNKATPEPKPKQKQAPKAVISPPKSSTTAAKTSNVKFDTNKNQVQEIPRIGTQKLPPKPSSNTPPASRPFEKSAFSGIVQEKREVLLPSQDEKPSITERPVRTSRFAASRPQNQPTSTQPKRMSRFARERQGLS